MKKTILIAALSILALTGVFGQTIVTDTIIPNTVCAGSKIVLNYQYKTTSAISNLVLHFKIQFATTNTPALFTNVAIGTSATYTLTLPAGGTFSDTIVGNIPVGDTGTYYIRVDWYNSSTHGNGTDFSPFTPRTVYVVNPPTTPTVAQVGSDWDTLRTPSQVGFTYQWYENGTLIAGATNNYVSPLVNGASYTVTVTNSNGCSSASAPYSVVMATGIQNLTTKSEIGRVYPIPANDLMNIELSNMDDMTNVIISLYALDGTEAAVFQTDEINNGKIAISVRDIKSGIYMMNIVSDKVKMSKKIIVIH